MKKFEEFMKKGNIRKISPDSAKSKSFLEEAMKRETFLKEILKNVGLNEENSNFIIENVYDIIMSLIRAKLFEAGFKAQGTGAHEAEVSYLQKLGFSESEIEFMDELRFFRNRIKYDAKKYNKEYAEKTIKFLEKAKKKFG